MGRTRILMVVLLVFYLNVKSSLSQLSYSSNSLVDSTAPPLCLSEESSALLQFKTTLSPSPKTKSWNETTNCCLWEGITCDKVTAHVVALDLSGSCLGGSLSANNILFLPPGLQRLNLARNNLTGGFQSLKGVLPSHITGLQNLRELDLSANLISGAVPSWLFALPSLTHLNLSKNNLLSFPTDVHFQNPSSLSKVDFGFNHIHGSIPNFLFDQLVNLTSLYLPSNNLSGVISSETIAKAKSLETLDLSGNSLLSILSSTDHTDHVDQNASNDLSDVFLSSCNITRFPSFLKSANKLRYLDISNNKIQDSISKWEQYWPVLETLDATSNQLHGQIPTSFCNMSSLQYLDLSINNLGGTIPSCLATIRSLTEVRLQLNNLHGQIPAFESLQTLALNDNQLEGLLPRSLGNCTFLILLNVANNKLNDTFPHWLGRLPDFRYLVLGSNRFHGPLENPIGPSSFRNLDIIDLSHNVFNGTLPTNLLNSPFMKQERSPCQFNLRDYSDWCYYGQPHHGPSYVEIVIKRLQLKLKVGIERTSFTIIDFSNNQFSGGIPEALGEFSSLHMLNLSHNHLTGSIPPTFGHMAALESLDLSSNKLGGQIPSELADLTFLEVLNLSHNNLVGPIPKGEQFDTFDNDSYIGNPGLWGCPLSKQCHNNFKKQPQPAGFVDVHEDDDSGIIPFIWKVAAMGYGCGIVLGLSTGYIMFTTGRPWWIVRKIERDWQKSVTNWICKIRGGRRRN